MVPFIHVWRKVIAKRMIPTWQFLPKILHILLFSPHKPIEWFYIQSRKLKDSSDSLDYFPLVSGSSTNLMFKKNEVLFHAKSVLNPPCSVKVQSKSKRKSKDKSKEKIKKNESVKRLRCISDTP